MKFLATFAALPCLLAFALSCTPEEVPTAAEEPEQNEETAGEQTPDEPQDGAPAGSASVSDVTLATDALMRLVADSETDARAFDIRVEGGVVTLTPDEGTEERLVDRARGLIAEIDGVNEVVIPGRAAPDEVDEDNAAAAQALEEARTEEADTPDAEDAVAAAAELGEPTERQEEPEEGEDEQQEAAQAEPELRSYTVRPGDSLSGIAAREMGSGSHWRELYEFNRQVIGPNPDGLNEGMTIRIPNVED